MSFVLNLDLFPLKHLLSLLSKHNLSVSTALSQPLSALPSGSAGSVSGNLCVLGVFGPSL